MNVEKEFVGEEESQTYPIRETLKSKTKEFFVVEKIEDALEEYKKLYNVDFSHPVPMNEFVENTSYILCSIVVNINDRVYYYETTPPGPETYHIIRVKYTHFVKKNNICIYFFEKEGEQFAYSFSNICFENKNAIIFHYTEEYPCK